MYCPPACGVPPAVPSVAVHCCRVMLPSGVAYWLAPPAVLREETAIASMLVHRSLLTTHVRIVHMRCGVTARASLLVHLAHCAAPVSIPWILRSKCDLPSWCAVLCWKHHHARGIC
jgi:hypothetical protein